MAVYVDDMRAPFGRMLMCHMIADTDEELHHMADLIGVARKWWQAPPRHDSHYDVALNKRAAAVGFGAVEVTLRQLATMVLRRRATGALGKPEHAIKWFKENRRKKTPTRKFTPQSGEFEMRSRDLWNWIKERESIRRKKEANVPQGLWTKDAILGRYRFCNVHRENDRVTKALAALCRDGTKDNWFTIVVSRLLNNPDSMTVVGSCVPWNAEQFIKRLHAMRSHGLKIFNAAYIVSTNGRAMDKVEYLARCVLTPMWIAREQLRPMPGDTLHKYHARLLDFDGMGTFIAAQVVGDLKFSDPILLKSKDWWTWAAAGPGSKRGLNRIYNRPVDQAWKRGEWEEHHGILLEQIDILSAKQTGSGRVARISGQDLQNCLCEFDKYERARTDQGKPKQIYKPQEN